MPTATATHTNGHASEPLPPQLRPPTRPAPTTRDLAMAVLDEALRLCLEAQCVPPAMFERCERTMFDEARKAAERRALAVATDAAGTGPDIMLRVRSVVGALSQLSQAVGHHRPA